MGILDIFKKKKQKAKKAVKEKKAVQETKVEPKTEPQKQVVKLAPKQKGVLYTQVKVPHISEKATDLGVHNQYVFNVYNSASKTEIKAEIEGIYNVDVLAVNTINIHPKKRKLGKSTGFKKGYKKAIVTIKAGQKIEII